MLLVAGYEALSYVLFLQVGKIVRTINPQAAAGIRFADFRLSLLPPGVTLRNVKNFPLRHRNLVSFESINVSVPLTSLFASQKTLNIQLNRPLLTMDSEVLPGGGRTSGLDGRFRLGKIDINHGRLQFRSGRLLLSVEDFSLRSRPHESGTMARLEAPYMRGDLPLSREPSRLEGQLSADIHLQRDGTIRIARFLWQTREMRVGLNGHIAAGLYMMHATVQGNPARLLEPILGKLTIDGLIYASMTIRGGKGTEPRIRGEINAPGFAIKEIVHQQLEGTLAWNGGGKPLEIDAAFSASGFRSLLHVETGGGQTDIRGRNIPGLTLARVLGVEKDAPLAGVARSMFVHISSIEIAGEAELSRADAPSSPFALDGRVVFRRDKRKKETTFTVEKANLPVGRVTLRGRSGEKRLDLDLQADFRDLQNLDPLSRYYLKLNLAPWRLENGRGTLQLNLHKRNGHSIARARVDLRDFRSRRQAIVSLQGDIVNTPPATNGSFRINSRAFTTRADIAIAPDMTRLTFTGMQGQADALAQLMELNVPLAGKISGDFEYSKEKKRPAPVIRGRLRADRLDVAGQTVENISTSLQTTLKDIRLSDLRFRMHGGQGEAAIAIDFAGKRFDIRGQLLAMNINRLNRDVSGQIDLHVAGQGRFMQDPLTFDYRLTRARYNHDHEFQVSGRGELRTDLADFNVATSGTLTNPAGTSPYGLELRLRNKRYSGSFNLELNDLNLLIPWPDNSGQMKLLGEISGASLAGLDCRGVAVLSGETIALPNFPHSLNHFQGNVTFSNLNVNLQSLSGELGGGRAEFNGHVNADRNGLHELELNMNGRDMTLFPMDRVNLRLNTGLTLSFRNHRLLLSGNIHLLGAEWERQIDEPISFSSRSKLSASESHIRETLNLDIRLSGEDNIWMNNAFGRIGARLNLHLSGSARYPQIVGSIEGKTGTVNFSERKFALVRGRISFNRFSSDPLIQIESESFIQSYRISMFIRGSLSHPKPELVSSPPLPPQDILALISLGEIFKRPGSEEVSSQLGSTALLTTELTKEIKNRANKLLGIDMLRLDPLVNGTTGTSTSRLTVGKTLSKNLIVVYSTNLATYRQEIYYLQYQLSPTLSLIAMRNEEGNYAFDFRFRKRK